MKIIEKKLELCFKDKETAKIVASMLWELQALESSIAQHKLTPEEALFETLKNAAVELHDLQDNGLDGKLQ